MLQIPCGNPPFSSKIFPTIPAHHVWWHLKVSRSFKTVQQRYTCYIHLYTILSKKIINIWYIIYIYICIHIRRPQPAAGGAHKKTPSKRNTTGNLFSARAVALASWRMLLAFFLDRSEINVRPSGQAAAWSFPSFTAMLSKRGGPFPSRRLLLAFFLGRGGAKPSVLHRHGVLFLFSHFWLLSH